MGSQLTTLTSADIRRFERDGYTVVRQAFAPADGLAMERQWWRELEDAHGIRRDDRSSWRQLPGHAPSPPDRTAAFMDRETVVDGMPLRVVELTGEPGDMVLCHPAMVHCAAPNRGTWPRFVRIKTQILTREGRELIGSLERPPA